MNRSFLLLCLLFCSCLYPCVNSQVVCPWGSSSACCFSSSQSGTCSSGQIAQLLASGGVGGDQMGFSSAISDDGSTAIVGAFGVSSRKGAAYIFVKGGASWTQAATLTASTGANGDYFGYRVGISPDGSTVIVGAKAVSSFKGAAYIFVKGGASWTDTSTPTATLTASTGANGDYFGDSVGISSDGSTVIVGADGVSSLKGAAYIFVKSGASWTDTSTPTATLTASTGANYDNFGTSIGISSDGSTVIVGAIGVSIDTGAAYIFVKSGASWTTTSTPTATLTVSAGASFDYFGTSVGISSDGSTAIVGAYGVSSNKGAAYIFGAACGSAVACSTGYCTSNVCTAVTVPVISSIQASPSGQVSIGQTVTLQFTLSDSGGESSTITISWGDGAVDVLSGTHAPGSLALGSHSYSAAGTYCIKVCANDGTGSGTCDAAFFSTITAPCSKKRAPGGSALSITVGNSAGGDPYYLGYDGKTFEFHGYPGEVYNLISSAASAENIWLNVQFDNGYASDYHHTMGVVMRSIGLVINQLRIIFTVSEQGIVKVILNGIEISSFHNDTVDGIKFLFEPKVNFSRTALHMSAHDVHHHLLVKTPEIIVRLFGVKYQPPSWKTIENAPYFHFVDLEANIIDPTFCPDGVWGRTACGGHHDPLIDSRYRIQGDNLLGDKFDSQI